MKNAALVVVLACLVLLGVGCKGHTTEPSSVPSVETFAQPGPAHHNIPATMKAHPEGPVYWLCATAPRRYVDASGTVSVEEDHYLQTEPCSSVLEP